TVLINGLKHLPRRVDEAVDANIYLVPDNRLRNSIFPGLSVEENLLTSSLPQLSPFGFIRSGFATSLGRRIVERLRVKCSSSSQDIMQLSGGNQQKVAFG